MKIAVCAGEKSGDALGHELLVDLKENIENLEVIGVGGSLMEGEGLKSFFPIKEISLIGKKLFNPSLSISGPPTPIISKFSIFSFKSIMSSCPRASPDFSPAQTAIFKISNL